MKNVEDRPYYHADEPQVIAAFGEGPPEIVFNFCTHGNEEQPLLGGEEIIESLDKQAIQQGSIKFTVANIPALREGKRFLYTDLNRGYPGDMSGIGETRIAAQMLPLIADATYLIDMHTSVSAAPMMIVGRRNAARLKLAEIAGIRPIVLFEAKTSVAMADFTHCGIGIECGTHEDPQSAIVAKEVIHRYLVALGFIAGTVEHREHEYFEVVQMLPQEEASVLGVVGRLVDFKPIDACSVGIENASMVYPTLISPPEKSPIYTILLRKVSRSYVAGETEEV